MIVNRAQDGNQIHTRFNPETRLAEMTFVPAGTLITPEPFKLDYHQIDKLASTLDEMTLAINELMDKEVAAGLIAMGIEPGVDLFDVPKPYEAGDYLAEAVTEYWGRRCPDVDPECACCKAWAQYDALKGKPPIVIEEGHDHNFSMSADEKREVAARYGMEPEEMQGLIDQFNPDKNPNPKPYNFDMMNKAMDHRIEETIKASQPTTLTLSDKMRVVDISKQPEQFAHTPETCPSKHWNRGDDICADCGEDLNPKTYELIIETI